MRPKLGWGAKVGLTAAGMVTMLLFIPIRTSLGQGIHENVLVGWQGRYDRYSHQYYLRFLISGGQRTDVPLRAGFSPRLLTHRGAGEFWLTDRNSLPVLKAAYRQDPRDIEQDLGTRANVADPASPFPGRPVAYSATFLQALTRMHFNPRQVGGPNIPPGRVPWSQLPAGVLQIDTRADNNTLRQLRPQQTPKPLQSLWARRPH